MENPVGNRESQDSSSAETTMNPADAQQMEQKVKQAETNSGKAKKLFSYIVIASGLVSVVVLILFNTGSQSSLPFWTLKTRTQALLAAAVFFVLMTAGKFFVGLYFRIFKVEKTAWMNLAGLLLLVAISLAFFLLASIVITLAKGYVF
ncbi:MAG: hypothetical protein LWX00_03005 [Spirochaetia bacterium]|nr:hypothetical protein [Spirochaetia bacterium]